MSATPFAGKTLTHDIHEQRAGAVALVLLRFTLMGVGVALVATIGSVVWKVISG